MSSGIRVILVRPRNPLNIGAAARAMSNFGFSDLCLVQPYRLAVDEARSGVNAGAVLRDAQEFSSVREAVAPCQLVVGTTSVGPREPVHPVLDLRLAGPKIARARGSVAILFGSEKHGLSNEDMSHCHWLARIPTREAHHSMNLGQAVAITLYELVRRTAAGHSKPGSAKAATAESTERLTEYVMDSLLASGYTAPANLNAHLPGIRRLVRRLKVSEHDAILWMGIFRQILWRIRTGKPEPE